MAAMAPPFALFNDAAAPVGTDVGMAVPVTLPVADALVAVASDAVDEAEAEPEPVDEGAAEPVEQTALWGRLVTPAVPQMPLANLTVAIKPNVSMLKIGV